MVFQQSLWRTAAPSSPAQHLTPGDRHRCQFPTADPPVPDRIQERTTRFTDIQDKALESIQLKTLLAQQYQLTYNTKQKKF
jgi:hypothetical protein